MAQYQPTGPGFDRRSTIAKLNKFPGKRRFENEFRIVPEINIIRIHQVDVFVVLTREHGVKTSNFAREKSHAFILHGRPIESHELEMQKIRRLEELRQDEFAVVRGV